MQKGRLNPIGRNSISTKPPEISAGKGSSSSSSSSDAITIDFPLPNDINDALSTYYGVKLSEKCVGQFYVS